MKKHILIILPVVAIISLVIFLIDPFSAKKENSAEKYIGELTNTDHENPQARAEMEFLMMRDPVTKKIPGNIRAKEINYSNKIPIREKFSSHGIIQSEAWMSLGPTNVGGRTRAIQQDVSEPNTFIAGGASGGVFKTTNRGESWYRVTSNSIVHSVTTIVQDTRPGKTNHWYFAGGEVAGAFSINNSASANGAFYKGNGIYRSTDGGESWRVIPTTFTLNNTGYNNPFQAVYRLRIDPSVENETHIYAATLRGILRSTNGGNSWNTIFGSFSGTSSYFTDIEIADNGTIYASLSSYSVGSSSPSPYAGIFRSRDGEEWKNITPDDFPDFYVRTVMDVYDANPDVAYFLTFTPNDGYAKHMLHRFEANDSTYSWQNLSNAIPHDTSDGGLLFRSQNAYDLTIGVKPDDENYVFIGGVNLFRTTNGFEYPDNVEFVGGTNPDGSGMVENTWVDHHRILFSYDDPDVIYIGNDGGVKRSKDCTADEMVWEDLSNNYVTSQFYTIAINEVMQNNGIVIGGLQDRDIKLVTQIKGSSSWFNISIGDGGFTAVSDDGHSLFVSNQHTNILRLYSPSGTFNNDIQTARVDPGLSKNIQLWINPFIIDPHDDDVLYIASRLGIIRIKNVTVITDPSTIQYDVIPAVHGEKMISALSISRDVPHVMTYGTEDGKLFRLTNANISGDAAVEITSDLFPENAFVSSIHTDPFDYDQITVTFSNYHVQSIFHSEDGGESWINISGNLEENPDGSGSGPSVRWITSLQSDTSKIYFAATSTGLYSTDKFNKENTVWRKEGRASIGNAVVSMVKARDSDGLVVAATHGVGVFAGVFNQPVTGIDDQALLAEYSLSQNYPNPFNPSTTISFSLPHATDVKLKVYDSIGKEVAELVNSKMSAGTHELKFNAENMASGMYVYKLITPSFTDTKKMLLVK